MGYLIGPIVDICIAMVFLIPIMVVYNKFRIHNLKITFLYLIFEAYLVAIYSLVGLPTVRYVRIDFNCNLIPLVGMVSDLSNALLNVLLFIPLGMFLPVLCGKYRDFKKTLFFGLVTTLAIELLQIFTYRATDINDIITNVAGTMIGYVVVKCFTRKFTHFCIKNNGENDVYIVCGIAFGVMLFMHPFLASVIKDFIYLQKV